jgi:hypothetical protein
MADLFLVIFLTKQMQHFKMLCTFSSLTAEARAGKQNLLKKLRKARTTASEAGVPSICAPDDATTAPKPVSLRLKAQRKNFVFVFVLFLNMSLQDGEEAEALSSSPGNTWDWMVATSPVTKRTVPTKRLSFTGDTPITKKEPRNEPNAPPSNSIRSSSQMHEKWMCSAKSNHDPPVS